MTPFVRTPEDWCSVGVKSVMVRILVVIFIFKYFDKAHCSNCHGQQIVVGLAR